MASGSGASEDVENSASNNSCVTKHYVRTIPESDCHKERAEGSRKTFNPTRIEALAKGLMLAFPSMVTFSAGTAGQGSEGPVGPIQGRAVGNASIRQRTVVTHLYRHSFDRRVAFRSSSGDRRRRAATMAVLAGLWSAHHSNSGLTRVADSALGDRPALLRVSSGASISFFAFLRTLFVAGRRAIFLPLALLDWPLRCGWGFVAAQGCLRSSEQTEQKTVARLALLVRECFCLVGGA
jgi:hypothetical protein